MESPSPYTHGRRSPCPRHIARRLGAAMLAALLAGCYTYTPLDGPTPSAGSSIRARLAAPAAQRLAPSLGNGDARVLTGVVVNAAPETFTLEVATVPMGTATARQGLFQRVNLGRADVLELERRTLDKPRTSLVVVAAAVGIGVITAAIIHGQSTGSNSTAEPGSNFNRRPVVTLRF